jgi:endonuclease YncB( thermonuclease family)
MLRICSLIVSLALGVGMSLPASAQSISGTVRVIDGDTLDVGRTRVRLHAIDAPEGAQTCEDGRGGTWACGTWVSEQVRAVFGGQRAVCAQVDTDRYGRAVARCTVGGEDMGARIVAEGWAMAYRRYGMDYDLDEKAAAVAGRGIWSGGVEAPDAYRARLRQSAVTGTAPDGCAIKGNISGSGRIYHMPGQADYDATVITESRGERWFCTEAEAQAAGWRRARR